MKRFRVAAVDAHGPHWTCGQGRLRLRADDFRQVHDALRRNRSRLRARDLSFGDFLGRVDARQLSRSSRDLALALVEGFDAADPARVSARSIVEEWVGGEALDSPQFRPLGGYGALLAPLAASLERGRASVRTNAVVHTVRWRRGAVDVGGAQLGEPFRVQAKRAIVTLPLGVLQRAPGLPGAVRFDPPLAEKARTLRQLASGPVLENGPAVPGGILGGRKRRRLPRRCVLSRAQSLVPDVLDGAAGAHAAAGRLGGRAEGSAALGRGPGPDREGSTREPAHDFRAAVGAQDAARRGPVARLAA